VYEDTSAAAAVGGSSGAAAAAGCSSLESMYFTAPQQLLQVRRMAGAGCASHTITHSLFALLCRAVHNPAAAAAT
jgi:hypothetical protein